MTDEPLTSALAALDQCESAVRRLHKMCCEPDRSPRLAGIESELAEARSSLLGVPADSSLEDVLLTLTAIGSQVGTLQVECCAPARMPLYAETLENLTATQWSINQQLGRGH